VRAWLRCRWQSQLGFNAAASARPQREVTTVLPRDRTGDWQPEAEAGGVATRRIAAILSRHE
jgi:hypothetical protein